MAYPIRIDVREQLYGVPSALVEQTATLYAQEVAKIARRIVPVDTGRLKKSISARKGIVSAGQPYAGYVEYGTRRMNAQPYIRPAMERANLRAIVDKLMDRYMKKDHRQRRVAKKEALRQDVIGRSEQLSELLADLVSNDQARRRLDTAIRGLLRTWGSL